MKITNSTDFGIKIDIGGVVTHIPAGESANIIPSPGKITVYSDNQTSTRVEEETVKVFHSFYTDITTSCTADLSGYPESSETVITSVRKEFQAKTGYEYFLIKCNGNIIKSVLHEVCDGDKVISDRKKFYSDYKAEKNVNNIFGFFNKIDDFFSDVVLILLIGLFSLPFTLKLTSSLIFTGIVLGLYLILLLPLGGLKRSLRRSNVKAMQIFFKEFDEPDDLEYFIKHINKYCK